MPALWDHPGIDSFTERASPGCVHLYCRHDSISTFRSKGRVNSKTLVYLSGIAPKRNYYATTTDNQSSSSPDDEPGYSISRVPYIGDPFSDTRLFRDLWRLVQIHPFVSSLTFEIVLSLLVKC